MVGDGNFGVAEGRRDEADMEVGVRGLEGDCREGRGLEEGRGGREERIEDADADVAEGGEEGEVAGRLGGCGACSGLCGGGRKEEGRTRV